MTENTINAIEYVPVEQIEPNPNQHRNVPDEERMWELLKEVDEMLEDQYSENLDLTGGQELAADVIHLAESIDSQGLLQAIRVSSRDDELYQIVYGEMRWWAHRWAGRDEIAAQIVDIPEADQRVQSVLENILRRETDALEKGRAAYHLFMAEGITENPDIIANLLKAIRSAGEPDWERYHVRPTVGRNAVDKVCGLMDRSPRTIERWLRACSIAPATQEEIIENQYDLADRVLARISRIEMEELQIQAVEKIVDQGMTAKDASKLVTGITELEADGQIENARATLDPNRHFQVGDLEEPEDETEGNILSSLVSDGSGEEDGSLANGDQSDSDSKQQDAEATGDHADEEVLYVPDLYQELAESLLSRIPDNSVDCVITDPPYGGDFEANWESAEDYTEHNTWDGLDALKGIPEELERVLTPNSNVFVCCVGQNICEMKAIFEEVFEFDHLLTWVKDIHNVGGGFWHRMKEQILCFEYEGGSLNGENHIDVLEIGRKEEHGDQRDNKWSGFHANQKPRRLFEELIEIATQPGDVVLDPYGGSYSVARAAMVTERRSVSCELNEEIHKQATELMEHQLQWERAEGFGKINEDLEIVREPIIN